MDEGSDEGRDGLREVFRTCLMVGWTSSCAFEEWIAPGVNIKCKMALTPEEWNERDEQEKEYNKKKEERRKESKRRNKKQKNK